MDAETFEKPEGVELKGYGKLVYPKGIDELNSTLYGEGVYITTLWWALKDLEGHKNTSHMLDSNGAPKTSDGYKWEGSTVVEPDKDTKVYLLYPDFENEAMKTKPRSAAVVAKGDVPKETVEKFVQAVDLNLNKYLDSLSGRKSVKHKPTVQEA